MENDRLLGSEEASRHTRPSLAADCEDLITFSDLARQSTGDSTTTRMAWMETTLPQERCIRHADLENATSALPRARSSLCGMVACVSLDVCDPIYTFSTWQASSATPKAERMSWV